METTITVQGAFSVHHPAERGIVRLGIGFEGAKREPVVEHTTERHQAVSEQLRALTDPSVGPVTWWASDQVRVWASRPWNQDGKQLPPVYHGAVDVEAKFSDFVRLSEWVGQVSLSEGVTVNGIEWTLTEARRQSLTQEARRRAVENAVAKATVYATSVGLSAVRAVALSDPGMLGDGSTSAVPSTEFMSARMMAANAPQIEFKPNDIAIDVQVHARFVAS
jgi:uncharacterized protein YggE